MRKKMFVAVAAGIMTMALSLPVFAGEWQQSETGWWYQNDDGSHPNSGWTWVDGKCYYFTPEGYCLMDTQTPDGYTVDSSGAWVIDGVVQTQESGQSEQAQAAATGTTVSFGNMTFTVPNGFVQDTSQQGGIFLFNESQIAVIAFVSETMPELGEYQALVNSMQQQIMDTAVQEYVGVPTGKGTAQFNSGVWYRYDYADTSSLGIPGSMRIYTRISGADVQMMVFAGNISGMDMEGIMRDNLR